MRKFLLLIAGVFMAAGLGYAASGDDIVDRLFDEAGIVEFDPDLEAMSDLSLSEEPFSNLYLFMYQNVKLGPQRAAITELALHEPYSEDELERLFLDGSLSVVQDYFEDAGLTISQSAVSEEYSRLLADFDEELNFQINNATVAYEALAQEIFMNGDLSDSANIDLLYELDLVHYLLFGSFMELPDRADGEEESVQLTSEAGEAELARRVRILLSSEEEDSALVCNDDEDLRDALAAYEEAVLISPEDYEGVSSGAELTPVEDDVSERVKGESMEDVAGRSVEEPVSREDLLDAISGTPGNWSRGLPCNDIFCITVNLVTQEGDSDVVTADYAPTDNSVAAHIAYIAARMDETVEGGLQANKVPMNWGEDGTCKESGNDIEVDLNVYLVKKPISLSPGDDIEELPTQSVQELHDDLLALKAIPNPSLAALRGKSPEDMDFEHLAYFGCNASQEDCLADALIRQEVRQQAIDETYEGFLLESRGGTNFVFYEQLAAELYSFALSLDGFQTALKDSYITGEAPLEDLLNTPYCE